MFIYRGIDSTKLCRYVDENEPGCRSGNNLSRLKKFLQKDKTITQKYSFISFMNLTNDIILEIKRYILIVLTNNISMLNTYSHTIFLCRLIIIDKYNKRK